MKLCPSLPRRSRMMAIAAAIGVLLTLIFPEHHGMWAQDLTDQTGPAALAGKGRKPMVQVSPNDVLVPESIAVTGSGFDGGTKGTITLSPGGAKLGVFKTDRRGKVTKTVRVPEVKTGSYTVTVKAGKRSASAKVTIGNPPGGPVALGVFTPALPADLSRLDSFEKSIGRTVPIVMWFQAWAGGNQTLSIAQVAAIADRGAMPMITWEPFDPAGGTVQPIYALDNLCSVPGALVASPFDPYIDDWATKLAGYGKPVLLRFAHEMTGNWYSWSEQVNGNQPGDYVQAWNCLRARFAAKGATNVQWVWSPNVDYPGGTPYAQVFPGDGAVNWIAIDGYNWGSARPDHGWRSFAQLFGPSIGIADAMSNRPIMIGETASVEQGGNKAAWITDALMRQIPLVYPQVRALVWFNMAKEADWRISSSKAAKEAFTAAVAHPYWNASLATASHGWPAGATSRVRNERRSRTHREEGP